MKPDAVHGLDHETLAAWLPLAAAGTLAAAQRDALDRHLAACPGCREELAMLAGMRQRFAAADGDVSEDAARLSMNRVWRRMREGGRDSMLQELLRGWRAWPALAQRLFAVQAMATLALGLAVVVLVTRPADEPRLATASTPPDAASASAEGMRLRVMWRDDARSVAVRELLLLHRARIVAGPSAAGYYIVQLPADAPGDTVALLRGRQELVRWIEPQ